MNVSILYLNEHSIYKSLSPAVIRDCGLDRSFSRTVSDILRYPCSKEEITERQKLFMMLEDAEFQKAFSLFEEALTDFSRACKLYDGAETECERFFLFYGEIKSYGSLLHAMKAMPCSDSVFIKKLHGFSDAGFYTLSENEEKISGYKNLLCSVSESKLNINGRSVCLMKNPEGTGKRTLTETVARCISSFGYPEYNTERKTIKMSLPVSEMLMMLYHAEFEKIKSLFSQLSGVMDKSCLSLCGDVRFYTEVTEVKKKALSKGTCVCYPKVSEKKQFTAKGIYDISLLSKLRGDSRPVPNDAFFSEAESCFFLTGANGGGKTTYLRSLASSLIMFLSGCFICAVSAEIFPFETIFTHFPADEHFEHGGRLSDEEKRIKEIVSSSDGGSFVFLNELFSGTDMSKGLSLSLDYMKQLKEAGAFCLFVTHFHDAADSGFPVLYAAIDKEDENKRTYRIERGVHKRKSYASDILRKYGMDAESLSGKGGAQ